MIEKRDITKPQSFAYLRGQLDIGKTLSSSINKLPLEEGRVFAFVPEGTSEDLLFSFESGGIYSYEEERKRKQSVVPIKNESRPFVMKEILTHISSSSKNCCLFEEALAITSDPWVAGSGIKYVHLQSNEMFYFFDGNNREQEINDAFKQSESHVFLCALSSLNDTDRKSFSPYNEITLMQIESFVKNVSSFFVKAYDGEGYLMWLSPNHEA